MKRFFALMAVVLGMVSCQTEPEGLGVNVAGEQDVNITVSLPEGTRANSALGAFENVDFKNYDVRFQCEVHYKGQVKVLPVQYGRGNDAVATATFPVRLIANRDYKFVVWADLVKEGETADLHYNTSAGLHNITINDWKAMDETRDAFTCSETRRFERSNAITLELTRPFAKLRVITTDMKELMGIVPTMAEVEYTTKYRNSFNAVEAKAGDVYDTKTHNLFEIASYGESGANKTLFADYLFASEGDIVNFSMNVYDQNGDPIDETKVFNTSIPVKRNYVTTIKGNILTYADDFTVNILPGFDGEEIVKVVDTAEGLQELIDNAIDGVETTITLSGDIDLGDLFGASILSTRAAATLPIDIAEGKVVVLDLNGHKITTPWEDEAAQKHYYAFENRGSLTIQDSKGNGEIKARGNFNYGKMTLKSGKINACDGNGGYGVRNYEGAEFVMNGGSIVTSYEDGDTPGNGYDASPVRVDEGATATFNGGTINNISNFTVAIDNYGETTINGGTFTTIHTTIANSATMTINGGSFTCNGLDGITAHALWAAAGTTNINGGTFDGKDNYNGFNVDADKGAIVNINGGKFRPVHSGSLYGEGTINVVGGEFFDNPSARVAEGYKVVENETGTYNVVEGDPVAKIGEVEYTTLKAAFEAVENGQTIVLTADVVTRSTAVLAEGKIATLDLNGKTLSAVDKNVVRNDGGNLTIKNGSVTRTGDVVGYSVNNASGEITIENATIARGLYTSGSKMTATNANISHEQSSRHAIYAWNCEVAINGGTYHNDNAGNATLMASGSSVVTINGGTFSIADGRTTLGWTSCMIDQNNTAQVIVKGGQFNGGFRINSADTVLTIEGGEFNTNNGSGYTYYNGAVSIKGGTYTDAAAKTFAAKYVAEGYVLDGDTVVLDVKVAKVGNTEYRKIDEAIAAWTNNSTLTLLADVTLNDVITINSTEHHILDLGTYTMTAAEGKNAFVIKACGTGDAERTAITIKADATNPGGINAGKKSIVYYKYADGGISGNDRPIIKIEGGVFNAATSSFGTAGIYTIGTAARKCATLNVSGGIFNCSINGSGKSKLLISGGVFNYSVGSQGDSTALRLIWGGKFKTFGFMTADSENTKFWFGTSMANSNVGLYINDEGYLVVGGPVITEFGDKFAAKATNATKWSSYLKYSSAAANGLYYTNADMAITKHGEANVVLK